MRWLFLLSLTLLISGDVVMHATDNTLPQNGLLAFASNRDGDFEIYTLNTQAYQVQRLTDNAFRDLDPAWSPDGEQLAFASDRDGDLDIYIMRADGSDVRPLTQNDIPDNHPVWSPDGTQIAYTSGPVDEDIMAIFVQSVTDTESRRISGDLTAVDPTWSPDGTEIAFYRPGGFFALDVQTGAERSLLTALTAGGSPVWSPDGASLLFHAWLDGDNTSDIYRLDLESGQVTQLINENTWQDIVTWSPDGNYIAYTSYDGYTYNIYIARSDGTDIHKLTSEKINTIVTSGLAWQPVPVPGGGQD